MVTIPHSVSKILSTETNLSQLSIIISCSKQSENTNSRIQEVKIWILKFLSQIILTFFKQTIEFFDFGICWCWFCCLRHQKSHAFCVIFTLLLAQTDSLWHRCRNISGLGGFCHFQYCHQKSKDFFSSAGYTLNKIQKKKDLRIIENTRWQFQHSSLFF